MKLETWSKKCVNDLEMSRFKAYKKHEFYRVVGDVFQSVSFQGQKNDVYIWYNVLPLALPNFNPSTGWLPVTGRAPLNEGGLFIKSNEDVSFVQSELNEICKAIVIPHLNDIQSIEALEEKYNINESPASGYAKGICNYILNRYGKARNDIETYLGWRSSFGGDKVAENILRKDEHTINEMLENERKKNIKKFHLNNYTI